MREDKIHACLTGPLGAHHEKNGKIKQMDIVALKAKSDMRLFGLRA